ncbi:MAG TPA: copper resistance protein NlpE [Thermoanaerobaculia bacterium]|jgi:copper homeostasis protein (lipoprotein)|nr:copper resistance protein NlpE [Thermoanaerobaculia bacterium]
MKRGFATPRAIFPILLTAGLLAACQGRVAPPVTSASDQVAPPVSVKKILAVYEGVLPCADCQGVRTVLTLFDDDSTYKLVETYLGALDNKRTVESDGRWTLRRPLRRDPEATVYQLDPDQPDKVRSFLVVDEEQIRQLDREGRELEPRLSYTLKRKSPPV